MKHLLEANKRYLCHCGIETDLIFNHGVDLPEFSLYPYLDSAEGRSVLDRYAKALIDIAAAHNNDTILETPTWMANADRAAALNYGPSDLDRVNRAAVALMRDHADAADTPVLVSANIGPSTDAYAPEFQVSVEDASAYHRTQIASVADAGADMVSGYTLAYVAEAAGIALAARDAGIPSVISFTVETNGALPDGTPLDEAISQCDVLTDTAPLYYMINCAHPDHFAGALPEAIASGRLRGLVVNASRCSHAELDEAEELDAGNPRELAEQLADLALEHPALQVFGGCCGTDLRHIEAMSKALSQTV